MSGNNHLAHHLRRCGGGPAERLRLIAAWTVLPDLVTANQGEEGILEVCELLVSRGVGIEAGLLSLGDARPVVAAGIAGRCVRAMVERSTPTRLTRWRTPMPLRTHFTNPASP
jgi:hypothetical protein